MNTLLDTICKPATSIAQAEKHIELLEFLKKSFEVTEYIQILNVINDILRMQRNICYLGELLELEKDDDILEYINSSDFDTFNQRKACMKFLLGEQEKHECILNNFKEIYKR